MENIEILIKDCIWNRVNNPNAILVWESDDNAILVWESDDIINSNISQHVSIRTLCVMMEDIKESVWNPVMYIIEEKV